MVPDSLLRYTVPIVETKSSCSKAPRGLFVLVQVGRIFTAIAISPSPSSRQLPSRSAFCAGRNLPDKEFRYLRTVHVVTFAFTRDGMDISVMLPMSPHRPELGRSPYRRIGVGLYHNHSSLLSFSTWLRIWFSLSREWQKTYGCWRIVSEDTLKKPLSDLLCFYIN